MTMFSILGAMGLAGWMGIALSPPVMSAPAERYSFRTVGVALWIISLALIAGFLVLATSSFELNAGMGVLTSIIIAFALLADFLLLPPLLIKLDGWLNPGD